MTIASEITRINGNIAAAYTAASNKSATLPATQNSANLATCIGTISTGTTPVINSLSVTPTTSAQTITATSGVDGYSPVNVSAVTSSIDANIVAGNIKNGVTILGVTGDYTGSGSATLITKSITQNGTYNASSDNADGYSSVTVNVAGGSMFGLSLNNFVGNLNNGILTQKTPITGIVDLTGVTRIGSYALENVFMDNQLTGVNVSSITTIDEGGLVNAFNNNNIRSVVFSSLTYLASGALNYTFGSNWDLTSLSFPALTSDSFEDDTVFDEMLEVDNGVTVHFPSNLEEVIGDWDSVTNGFSGDNTTVLFDLPATE